MVQADMDMSLPAGSIDPAEAADEIDRLTGQITRLRAALEEIASWDEGPTVNGTFDEPYSAKIARAALTQEPRT
jgi:hypothetical protein